MIHNLWSARRKIARENLTLALGHELSREEINKIAYRVFENIGRTTLELARFKQTKLEGVKNICVGINEHLIKEAIDHGRGLMVVTAHFGNWEMLGSWVATLGYPMHFFVAVQHNPYIDKMLVKFRREMGVEIINPSRGGVRAVFKALKNNHIVGIAADQHDPTGNLILDFFGRKATVPKGPAVFAQRAGCPLLPCLLRRERFDRHVVMASGLIYPDRHSDPEVDIERMTREHTSFLEDRIREYPDQWMWTHRRWKI
jgi:KDO2-lipid IV(A) lauroyltransferase